MAFLLDVKRLAFHHDRADFGGLEAALGLDGSEQPLVVDSLAGPERAIAQVISAAQGSRLGCWVGEELTMPA